MDEFLADVWRGLSASPKYLQSKYFYDEKGDAIFREIMDCPEYYLTRCELEIFSTRAGEMAGKILDHFSDFDVVELGPGDATKSVHLLQALTASQANFTYYPLDISENIIGLLEEKLPATISGIKVHGLEGDYFKMLGTLKTISAKNKVVLFLGSNIGNIPPEGIPAFFNLLKAHLTPGDLVIIGFDLKKEPGVILAAYNDAGGITRRFNMNLLQRINDTLGADFDLKQFEHRPEYDEETGACKSFLTSLADQDVNIAGKGTVHFEKGERIFMEVSQKYTVEQTNGFAVEAGFVATSHFFDGRRWFLDALWQCG